MYAIVCGFLFFILQVASNPTKKNVVDRNYCVGCKAHAYDGELHTFTITQPRAPFLVLEFSRFHLRSDDTVVVFVDDEESMVLPEIYDGESQKGPFNTRSFPSTSVTVEFHPGLASMDGIGPEEYGFTISAYRFGATLGRNKKATEDTCGRDDTLEAMCLFSNSAIYNNARAVTRLTIHKEEASTYCTGWLFGCDGHILTNHHCIANQKDATSITFEFMAEGRSCRSDCRDGGACMGKIAANSATFITASAELDYALIQPISENNLNTQYGYLVARPEGPTPGERLYIVQHPAGWGKRIATKNGGDDAVILESNLAEACSKENVGYYADTRGGSSGSPVISRKDHKVIALHNCGGCPNSAVPINKIVEDLTSKGLLPRCATARGKGSTSDGGPSKIEKLPLQSAVDGTIFDNPGGASVDHIRFTLSESALVQLDMLSVETSDYTSFKDLNSDCDASFIDSKIIVFQRKSPREKDLSKAWLVAQNDDAPQNAGIEDGSISYRDSFLQLELEKGSYVVAISRYPFTVEDAIAGKASETLSLSTTPHVCDSTKAEYGNYRFSIRAKQKIELESPNSFVGKRCDLKEERRDPSGKLEKCEYHIAKKKLPGNRAIVDGSIFRRKDKTVSVDHIPINVIKEGTLTIDVLAYEMDNDNRHQDVNRDCDGSYIDSVMYLFADAENGKLSEFDLLYENDDRTKDMGTGSLGLQDSYLKVALKPGKYILGIGRYPLTVDDVIMKQANDGKASQNTPKYCGFSSDYGNYQVKFSSTGTFEVKSPGSYKGNQCNPEQANDQVCPLL